MQGRFRHDFVTVKRYGVSGLEKLVYFKTLVRQDGEYVPPRKRSEVSEKLDTNIIRARTAVREIALCNEWQLFGTFTLSPEKYDRFNLASFRSDFSQFFRDQRKKWGGAVRYLLIPEQHKDGAWHMHGLLSGLPVSALRQFSAEDEIPEKMREKIRHGEQLFDWADYRRKFGWVSFSRIRDAEACASYVTKYISKDMGARSQELGAHLYYASQGLKRAETIYKGGAYIPEVHFDFENDYVKIITNRNPEYGKIAFTD